MRESFFADAANAPAGLKKLRRASHRGTLAPTQVQPHAKERNPPWQFQKRIAARVAAGIKKFQPKVAAAVQGDKGEADTSNLVRDILVEVLGYDGNTEVTAEFEVRRHFIDLAIVLDKSVQMLLEVKESNHKLKEDDLWQARNYAANHKPLIIEWVILTNSETWQVHHVVHGAPVDSELVFEFNFTELDRKDECHIEQLYAISREAWDRAVLKRMYQQKQALNRFFIGALALSPPVLHLMRRKLKLLSPKVKITAEQIADVLSRDVLKREILEGELAEGAKKKVVSALKRHEKKPDTDESTRSPERVSAVP